MENEDSLNAEIERLESEGGAVHRIDRKNAKTDIFPVEQGKANLRGAKTTNVKSALISYI